MPLPPVFYISRRRRRDALQLGAERALYPPGRASLPAHPSTAGGGSVDSRRKRFPETRTAPQTEARSGVRFQQYSQLLWKVQLIPFS